MKKHRATRSRTVYVGFLNYHPHVQQDNGARTISVYISKDTAERAYADVRKAELVFDADWKRAK